MSDKPLPKEKELCTCGKLIQQKKMADHLKSAGHLKSVVIPIPCTIDTVGTSVKPATEIERPMLRDVYLKKRFANIDSKLEEILDYLDEMSIRLFPLPDDQEEESEQDTPQ